MPDAAPDWIDALERPLAVVLGGGASLGASEIGMLRALLEYDIEPDLLVGTSVGAINAAYMARQFDLEQLERLESIWTRITRDDIFTGVGVWGTLSMLTGSRSSLATDEGLRSLLEGRLPSSHAELEVPTAVIATDILAGEKIIFEEGDLPEHVLISASIPIIFEPIENDGRTLVDGGVTSNVPILPAHQLGAKSMIVLDPGHACSLEEPPGDLLGRALHLMTLMLRHQSHSALPFLVESHPVVYLPPPCPVQVPPHDFSQTRELIDSSHRETTRFLNELSIDGPGLYGQPHTHTEPTFH